MFHIKYAYTLQMTEKFNTIKFLWAKQTNLLTFECFLQPKQILVVL